MDINSIISKSNVAVVTATDVAGSVTAGLTVVLPESVAEKFDVAGAVKSKVAFRKDKEGKKAFAENAIVFAPAAPSIDTIVNGLGQDVLTKILMDLFESERDNFAREQIVESNSIDFTFASMTTEDVIKAIIDGYSSTSGRKSSLPDPELVTEWFKSNFLSHIVSAAQAKGLTDEAKLAGITKVYLDMLLGLFSRKGSSFTETNFDQLIKMSQFSDVDADVQVAILERIKSIKDAREAKAKKAVVAADLF